MRKPRSEEKVLTPRLQSCLLVGVSPASTPPHLSLGSAGSELGPQEPPEGLGSEGEKNVGWGKPQRTEPQTQTGSRSALPDLDCTGHPHPAVTPPRCGKSQNHRRASWPALRPPVGGLEAEQLCRERSHFPKYASSGVTRDCGSPPSCEQQKQSEAMIEADSLQSRP